MGKTLLPAVRMFVVTALVLGLGYPLLVTGAARALFPAQARGSLVTDASGAVRGSRLIGQGFVSPRYFAGRPSAAGAGYDAMASGGSNLGPTSEKLVGRVEERVDVALAREPGLVRGAVPVDMVTASGSGLDPEISPANALAQVRRVARARGLREDEVRRLVRSSIEGRDVGFIGEPRVNVLMLNLALDRMDAAR